MKVQLLVVEDESMIRKSLTRKLEREGYDVEAAEDGAGARRLFRTQTWDLILLDVNLPDANGTELLAEFHEQDPDLPVIMLTGNLAVENVVKAMKLGAFNYITKPFNFDEVLLNIQNALEMNELRHQMRSIKANLGSKYGFDRVIGDSKPMHEVMAIAKTVAESEADRVLILGESGTGKNLLAQAIHYNSARAARPFMEVTCTALSETLLESELFGHEKGAFTDARTMKKGLCELAHGGTLFLDEIGDLSPEMQAKLLGFLESGRFRRVGGVRNIEVDVRIIAATNADIEKHVEEKRFREDLYYRLNVIEMTMPPLRARVGDATILAGYFIDHFNRRFKKKVKGISKDARNALDSYAWPGNVRELRNLIERAMILSRKDQLTVEDLPLKHKATANNGGGINLPPEGISLDSVEKTLVRQALERTRGNQTKAAKLLNLSRDQLRYRMKQYSLFQAGEET